MPRRKKPQLKSTDNSSIESETSIELSAEYRGPLPMPAHFDQYERTLPGAAERILAMGESEQKSRHKTQSANLGLERFKTTWGFVGWGLTLGATVYLGYLGETIVAAILGSGIGLSGIARILRAVIGRDE